MPAHPIFTVEFSYDPMTATDDYHSAQSAHGGGKWLQTISFVAGTTVIDVRIKGRHKILIGRNTSNDERAALARSRDLTQVKPKIIAG